jgi:hypothetical protein
MLAIWSRLLERLGSGDPVVGVEEYRTWGRTDFERAAALGILRETEAATWIMCDACPERHWSQVIRVAGGERMFVSCPETGTVAVEPWQLRQWRIDADRLAELTAGALELTGAIQTLLLQRFWTLGRRRLGGRYRDVFLGVGGGVSLPEMSAAIRRSIGQAGALLLTVGCHGSAAELPTGLEVVDLGAVSHLAESNVTVDLDYLDDRCSGGAQPSRRLHRSIPAPVGTAWKDVSISVFDEFLRITTGGKEQEVEFAQLGVDRQSQTIQLLKLFAAARGTLDAAKIGDLGTGDTGARMRIRRLRRVLQDVIAVDGDPIENQRKARAYVCQFEIRLAGDEGFRAPAGTTWLDLAFHERADGRILVAAPETRRFRARGAPNVNGENVGEVAEDRGSITRTYSLEEMGLRTEGGRLTPEGSAFVGLLRAGGKTARRGNDMVMLKLAKQLRDWTGLGGEPFRLVEASNAWAAVFACSSEITSQEK